MGDEHDEVQGINLLSCLKTVNYTATGTIRNNRLPSNNKDFCLTTPSDMKKQSRGYYDYVSCKKENLIIVRWMDNSVVTVASNCYSVEPVGKVDRYSQTHKKHIQITQPNLIMKYNRAMGGVDRMDQGVSNYRVNIRGKKWWWCIFTWMIDAAAHNAWVLMRATGSNISLLQFRREIVKTYLTNYKVLPKGPGRTLSASRFSNSSCPVSDAIRYDRVDHLIVPTNGERRRFRALKPRVLITPPMYPWRVDHSMGP
ncbi:piggyBac transposable element-derived protein 3-like [Homalodisca vitripennis]|uniref:piggyBac transposable element-derived protein 3-like n=1 Tax=Homalodisca vitripennis TaxID=197043 RepID=UPI001EEAE2F9|nr:piggyBac transposable element-derived protein 3-like [Homalodisca vitripennis]